MFVEQSSKIKVSDEGSGDGRAGGRVTRIEEQMCHPKQTNSSELKHDDDDQDLKVCDRLYRKKQI